MNRKRAYRGRNATRGHLTAGRKRLASLATFLLVSSSIGAAMFVGCTSEADDTTTSAASTSGNFTTGTMNSGACNNAFPDGVCNVFGQDPESCECEDCKSTATCNGRCEGSSCNYSPGVAMDCTCDACKETANCLYQDANCDVPDPEDDDYDPACNTDEACVCVDCADIPECQGCDNNGACNIAVEGCGCGDCAGTEVCGGTSGPSSSSAGGAGGAGGGAGGAASSSSSSSSSASAGGAGGAGGA